MCVCTFLLLDFFKDFFQIHRAFVSLLQFSDSFSLWFKVYYRSNKTNFISQYEVALQCFNLTCGSLCVKKTVSPDFCCLLDFKPQRSTFRLRMNVLWHYFAEAVEWNPFKVSLRKTWWDAWDENITDYYCECHFKYEMNSTWLTRAVWSFFVC